MTTEQNISAVTGVEVEVIAVMGLYGRVSIF